MAFVVAKRGSWEIRESHLTDAGPRSRTLATFTELDDGVLDRAESRAEKPIDRVTLRNAARRAGAPAFARAADKAAATLLTELRFGRLPRRAWRELLVAGLSGEDRDLSAEARAVGEWAGASLAQRGDALLDLLGLADSLPQMGRDRRPPLDFPRLRSA